MLAGPPPANHSYSAPAIELTLRMVLEGAVGFRACGAIMELLEGLLPQFDASPAPNTVQSWLLRLGLHELQRPKERADDWIFLVDHTLQLGNWKCLLIVGVRRSSWERLEQPLTHQDLAMLTLEPVSKSDGDQVCRQLQAAAELVGTPLAVLSDEGSDLVKGIAKLQGRHPQTRSLNDIAHKAAILLKRELRADPQWEAFAKHCGQTQPKVKQTELGCLAPPALKIKARYMNLGPLIAWGARMLQLVDTPPAERPAEPDLSRLEEKFGWIRDFREPLGVWRELQATVDQVLEYTRVEGYHARAASDLREILAPALRAPAAQRLAGGLLDFVQAQSQGLPAGESLPASSEALESLIGKGKRLQGQHSRGGFTKMILGMAASVVRITRERVVEALQTVRNSDPQAWCEESLGRSLTAQRRQALPVPGGTKTG